MSIKNEDQCSNCKHCIRIKDNCGYCFKDTDKEILNEAELVTSWCNLWEPIICKDAVKATDKVNHPKHYTTGKIETIEYIEDKLTQTEYEGYIVGNVLKYISRWRNKGGYEDLKKARWYLDRLIERGDSNGMEST